MKKINITDMLYNREQEREKKWRFISQDCTAPILSISIFAYSQTQLMNPQQINGAYVNTQIQSLHSAQAEQQTTSHNIK